MELVRWFQDLSMEDVGSVGGKNASLGEMSRNLAPLGIKIPDGFAVTSKSYREFIKANKLEKPIRAELRKYTDRSQTLKDTGLNIRSLILNGIFPISVAEAIRSNYRILCEKTAVRNLSVAVRSSATAEDLPSASFAGLHETFLNVQGKEQLLHMCKKCYASLFTDRAITYRQQKGFDHMEIALSVGIQRMVRADRAGSGVMFTLDTETGFPHTVLINAAWGLGENIVQGTINPDQYTVFKPLLDKDGITPILEKKLGSKEQKMIYVSDNGTRTKNVQTSVEEKSSFVLDDNEILTLSRWAARIEEHYRKAMDIEWVKDDQTGDLFIVQARPETVHSAGSGTEFKSYRIAGEDQGGILTGISIGNSIVHGKVRKVHHASDLESLDEDSILVTQMTEPDWVPAMKNVKGIITDSGGRTCHAAIISREMGIPAVIGTKVATSILKEGKEITLSCAGSDEGVIYEGYLEYKMDTINLKQLPEPRTPIMINLATPESALKWWQLPTKGVGLARMEFIISNHIKVHPMALIHFDDIIEESEREQIRRITKTYRNKEDFFIEKLSSGIAKIGASQYPKPVIVRTSDFKTNEYADLIGGKNLEPHEENPMLGWRGASRYYSNRYREGFALECRALKRVREKIGLDNIIIMIPFCRTTKEAEWVLEEMEKNGLKRGEHGLKVYMMCEIPSNVILAEKFARYFDGFSIGSNDLTQLTLGVDRDSTELNYLFDENDEAVRESIREVIAKAHKAGCTVGFCGQAPSDNPEYAEFLVECGIDSISVNPDSAVEVLRHVFKAEQHQHQAVI
ncbi:phosphoenolpyruvate synthase [Fodinibius sediminis]|uniref:Phosphoenolpyruvate synthase n=1 Tax=Fodinibius sediminis TaxID=1214077 RepID=A0A521CUS4_9BACT|nr:phosphoenolpyruvate synthase [Fodinibius sediminis]SMO63209.1 phosphoenolpyruvate synthase [Fodinibius sediminis]